VPFDIPGPHAREDAALFLKEGGINVTVDGEASRMSGHGDFHAGIIAEAADESSPLGHFFCKMLIVRRGAVIGPVPPNTSRSTTNNEPRTTPRACRSTHGPLRLPPPLQEPLAVAQSSESNPRLPPQSQSEGWRWSFAADN